jgi:hypothetical protein
MHTRFWFEDLRRIGRLTDRGFDRKLLLKWILRKYNLSVSAGFRWSERYFSLWHLTPCELVGTQKRLRETRYLHLQCSSALSKQTAYLSQSMVSTYNLTSSTRRTTILSSSLLWELPVSLCIIITFLEIKFCSKFMTMARHIVLKCSFCVNLINYLVIKIKMFQKLVLFTSSGESRARIYCFWPPDWANVKPGTGGLTNIYDLSKILTIFEVQKKLTELLPRQIILEVTCKI